MGSRALLIIAGVALLIRTAATAEPLGIDQSLWASAVRAMARGDMLYVDVWEQRPPGIYFTYLTGFALFGWREATVAWLDITAAAITSVLLWRVGRRLADDTTGALAAALFAALTIPAGLFGYGGFLERSVCETFIVAVVAAAALFATRMRDGGSIAGWAFAAGLAGGIAILYKPNAALYVPAIAAWWVLVTPAAERSWAAIVRAGLWMAAGVALPIALTMWWLWQAGALADARVAVVDFNRYYVTEGLGTPQHLRTFADRVFLRFKTEPVWTGGVLASLAALVVFARTRRLPPLPALAICWGAASTLFIFVNGVRLFNSYFLQAHAPLCLMAAWWLAERGGTSITRIGRVAVGAAMVFVLLTGSYLTRGADRTWENWQQLAGAADRTTYLEAFGGYANNRGYSARANQELADYLTSHSTVDEEIFLFGVNGAGIYFLADRLPAHRFLRVNFFYPPGFPDPAFSVDAVSAELARRQPRYVIFENLHAASIIGEQLARITSEPSVLALLEGYTFEAQIEDFAVYRRK